MRPNRPNRFAVVLLPLLVASTSHSQTGGGDVYWHMDSSVETCSMVIDPALTQGQWETFTRQAGAMISFKSLTSAEPIGKGRFSFGLDYSVTSIDQRDPAWINTFTHPDANCPLGDQIEIPSLRARVGVSERIDVAGYWTSAPGANYGEVGGEFRYAFRRETERGPAAAVSASFVALTGVPDFDFNVYSVGVAVSKRLSAFSPYLGVREHLAIATETTDKVNLQQERIPITQGFVGLGYSVWKLGVAAEYNVAEVNTLSIVIGSR